MFRLPIFLVSILALTTSLGAQAPRPNILYLYADDLGWGYIGANGQTQVKTPNLDSLASSGVNFTRGYGCNVCSPARSSQQTGFHQGHTWTDRNDPDSSKAIRSDDMTIGDMLSTAGYRTAYFGKWGYGADQDQNNPAINNTQTLPINHGYDVVLAELHHVRAHTFFQPTLWRSNTSDANPSTALVTNTIAAYNSPHYPTYPAHQNDPSYPSTAYCDDSYAFAALDFVRAEAQNNSAPFFCLLAFQIPHTPLGEIDDLPKWFDEYNNVDTSAWATSSKQFAAMVTRMDAHIGNILDALEDPNNDGDKSDSVLDNTLIVFASDNGGQSSGSAGTPLAFFSGNANLRGAKGSIYEGGIRVPMLMKWKGKLAANTVSSQVVDVTDMLPTFCDLAGIRPPNGIDGVSLAPTILGSGHQRKRDFIIHEAGSNSSIIRGNYKLVSKNSSRELYDLDTDPSESNNIASSNTALADELEALLLGERVKENDAFANTYHTWTGADNAVTSDATNWSDYDYSNNGTSYLSDNGAPRISWTALMENTTANDKTASADASLQTLSLEIRGGTHTQTLDLASHTLTGRNEIRISAKGKVLLDNGTLDTLRWVDLLQNGDITGAGDITGSLYHAGNVTINQSSPTTIPGSGSELILNGGFENGTVTTGGDYSYTTLENWNTNGPDPGLNGAVNSTPKSGTYRGLIQGASPNRDLYQNTGASISQGDTYTLKFWHRGFSNWSTGEEMEVKLYYLSGATHVSIYTSIVSLTNGSWNEFSANIPAISDPSATGKELHISFTPTNGATGFASLDDVSLVKTNGSSTTIPGHRKLNIGGIYHASNTASTNLSVGGNTTPGTDHAQIIVSGSATLAGSLTLTLDNGYTPNNGDTFTIITADSVSGRFQHADDIITVGTHRFKITYAADSVTLEKISTTNNGTPHAWLDSHGLNSEDYEIHDLEDPDADGIPTWKEFIAGTNPTVSSSVIAATMSFNEASQMYTLSWNTEPDRLYYVEHSDTLNGFTTLAGPFLPSEKTYALPTNSDPRNFYRIRTERM